MSPRDSDSGPQMEVPFDVTSLSVADLERAGVILAGNMVVVEKGVHRVWMPHSEFLAKRQDWDAAHRSRARRDWLRFDEARRARVKSLRARATDDEAGEKLSAEADRLEENELAGFRMHRSFPCLGVLRVEGIERQVRVVQCDRCGDRFGVGPKREDDRRPADGGRDEPWTAEF